MKFYLTPNLEPPFNLRRRSPTSRLVASLGEDEAIQVAIVADKKVGIIPCESVDERTEYVQIFLAANPGLTDADFPVVGLHWIVDESELPGRASDDQGYFFDVWEWDDGVVVNMAKARVLHMDAIRKVRDAELAKLDISWMKAVETEDTSAQATVAAEKQTLRDIPATFDITTGVDTAEKLFAKWPSELPARS